MLATALAGAVIAISFSAPPGPVAMETIRRGIRGGFGPALRVQLGSVIGDAMWCLIAILGLAPWVHVAWVRGALAVAGVGLLIYLGVCGIRDAFKQSSAHAVEASTSANGAFRSGMAISMANPMAVGYWLSVSASLVATGVVGASTSQTLLFIVGFLIGTLAWALIVAFAVRWSKRIMTPAIFRLVTFACGTTLLALGIVLASQMVAATV